MSCFLSVLRRRFATLVTLLILGGAALAAGQVFGTRPPSPPPIGHPAEIPPGPAVVPKETGHRRAELRAKLEGLEFQAGEQEDQLRDRARRLAAVDGSSAAIERQIEEIRTRQDRAAVRLRALEADEHRFREALPAGNEADALGSPVLDRLRAEIHRIREEIAIGGLERTPASAEYRTRRVRLAELEESLRSEFYRARAETIMGLKDSIGGFNDDLRALDERRMRKTLEARAISGEIRELASGREEIDAVRKELRDLEAQKSPVPDALPQGSRPSQEKGRALPGKFPGWGVLVVCGVALLGVFWREAADPRVRTDADVKRRLNIPAIALVENAGTDPFIFRRHPQDPLSETMSTAATVLRSYLAEREFRTLAVTSAGAGEGKTVTAMNLACALARKGLNVLLVDADLRRPRLHEIYGLDNAKGLSTLLLGPEPAEAEPDPDQIIVQTEIPTLRVLPSGPTNEIMADLHDSPRMIDFLRSQRERFDAVILDAAPLTGVGDAVALARVVDTCVWVVRSGKSDRRTLGWAKHLLKTVHADVAGVVLNFAPSSQGDRFYAYPVTGRA